MKAKALKVILRVVAIFLVSVILIISVYYLLQRYFAHRNLPFVPTYEKIELTENTDYETIFLQTGLGKPAVDKLIAEDNFEAVLEAQKIFFTVPQIECVPMLSWFTMEDRLTGTDSTPFVDLQAGDILVTLSTHSFGWRHGHAGLVIDEYTVLECQRMGTESSFLGIYYWGNYSNYAVLRPKNITSELQEDVIEYGEQTLKGRPYNLLSGIFGNKAPDPKSKNFGFYCTNLIWYAWNNFGIDIDSDGGKIVTSNDILHSDKLEVVQIYGIDPNEFIKN